MAFQTPVVVAVDRGQVLLDGHLVFTGSTDELLDRLDELASSQGPELVVTANVDQVLEMCDNERFRTVVGAASLRLLDGMPLVVLARMLGARRAHRHAGSDLVWEAAKAASVRGWDIVLAGGLSGVASNAVQELRRVHPTVKARAVDFPMLVSPTDPAGETVLEALRSAGPQIVFLGLGAPKQELWWAHWYSQLPAGVYIGSGAAADFVAGRVRRAPRWFQRLGAEWIWRLGQEPKRLARRYLVRGPEFLGVAAASLWGRR